MRANVHEVDDFVTLCAELQVDRLVLRPLNATEAADLVWDRAGYHFDYRAELLPSNPEHSVRIVDASRVEVLGKLVGIVRKV